jgi:hypothetical protein
MNLFSSRVLISSNLYLSRDMALESDQVGTPPLFKGIFAKKMPVGQEGYAYICSCFIKYYLLKERKFHGVERPATNAHPGNMVMKAIVSRTYV